jgi:putative RNA 2'-phosphotransferase
MSIDPVALSRAVSHALRHDPRAYGLEPDEQGWVDVDDLVAALRSVDVAWAELSAGDIDSMIEASTKRRHELRDARIRATYGHSTPDRIQYEPREPPPVLYHGTTRKAVARILAQGLQPRSRQYVHLSGDVDTARRVGQRRDRTPVILEVQAREAHGAGVQFFRPGNGVWLADVVPPQFVRRLV